LNINLSGPGLKSDWLHFNSVDDNPTLDQVMLSICGNSEVFVH